ncbi:putative F-box domain, leucine-rich repeat domain, L domain-containing protein [Rosa chinensis]|uniref:Putative F-box domain, leucine-rich repeat domain, L domain-containing protein n=1 Tax=Rosa chinensis TaxID=74649 RepID=A0A2P6P719_ROSCH|nr:putative F-box domain, leucine-rich repeat domain, L domain-containing protein [Rosa chinensis]
MASNSKRPKLCSHNKDRISGLPDALLCHILTFFSIRDAVKTCVLSHRWKNVWASVPNLDFDEEEYKLDYVVRTVPQPHNVVELVLRLGDPPLLDFEIPRRLFMCNTLVSLELFLHENIRAVTPPSNCFPCLKFLNVTFWYPDSQTLEKLFSCFPVLEDLIIDGQDDDASAFHLVISAPKLKRLRISFFVRKLARITVANDSSDENYGCQLFFSADAPNLEDLDIYYDFLVSYSLKNTKCLRKVEIDFLDVEELVDREYFLGLADRICQLCRYL